ncbi:NAD-dependent epimerase/dehydratase family protein [Sphingomonas sp.]|uniref:NAD-dependent epimerase/dehydratase family protein n=1 Tax=Sphingomonas sp. TaxID=28214 RepID=UPI0035C7FB7F
MILALSGATGFVGSHLLDLALAEGHQIRALTRRPQPERAGVTWVAGDLADTAALASLVDGADTVVHLAGLVNAPDRAGFARGNVDGTRAMVAASTGKRFVHVSSLAAREPKLSDYGWSKAEAERIVTTSDLDWTIVRPTGVYGPRDSEMREMFRMAKRGVVLLPPRGRVSLIAVEDLARLLLAIATQGGPRAILEADDGSAGYTHADLAHAIGRAVGRKVRALHMPVTALRLAARADMRRRGTRAKLTLDRVGYLAHPDWTAVPARRPSPALWQPRIALDAGLAATAAWYRAHGLL